MLPQDKAYALNSIEERRRRMNLLGLPHIKPLVNYLASTKAALSQDRGESVDMPWFDPCDGGINARALFLLETPGRKSSQSNGTGFISRNNPDPTAEHFCDLSVNAGIPREDTILWNIVPWYIGDDRRNGQVYQRDIMAALPYQQKLMTLLPHLQVIVLVGGKARSASKYLSRFTDVPIVETYHMSSRVWNQKHYRQKMEDDFESIAQTLRTI